MVKTRKKILIGIILAILSFFGFKEPVRDRIEDVAVGGFNSIRGFTTSQVMNECNTYVIPEASSASIDWNNGCVQFLEREENLTIGSFSNGVNQGRMALIVLASSSSPGTITWPSEVKWASASAPTLGAANRVDIIQFYAVSSGSYYGVETDRSAAQ